MKSLILLAIPLLFAPLNGHAVLFGGSNLGFSGYPSPNCTKPSKPFKPYSFTDQWQVDAYNSQVNLYNSQFQQYIGCIKTYIDNADNDIKRIKENVQEAINEANN